MCTSTSTTRSDGNYDEIPGIFAKFDPVPGAVAAFHELAAHFDVYILSTAPWNNPSAWSDKLEWVKRHFGDEIGKPPYKRVILSHHKHLNHGDYLIDDRHQPPTRLLQIFASVLERFRHDVDLALILG